MAEPKDQTSLTDHLAPLKWHGPMEASGMTTWFASTQFGQYMVKQLKGRTNWSYSYQNGGRATECESIEAGKAAAWEHWCENIQRCFTPHPMDHTLIEWPDDKTDTTG